MTCRVTHPSKALAAKLEIDPMLARLAALSPDHGETNPDEINWGQAGSLSHNRAIVRGITDSAIGEGEHAR
jgi:hypothetical protein